MNIIGLICEYNPFHNGHLYHIEKIKAKYPDSILILCLNGLFMERGEISILTKEDKVKIALEEKIDIVISLPVLYGTQSADIFANKAIMLLNALRVDTIIFGSECNNINYLKELALKQTNISKTELKMELKKGNSYPKSLINVLHEQKIGPNDLLGISYYKAILNINPRIKLETIKRTNDFHDLNAKEKIISALNIRNRIDNKEEIDNYVPKIVLDKIQKINYQLYFTLLAYKISTDDDLTKYLDVNEGIENKLKKEILEAKDYDDLLRRLKSKRYTVNRLKRMLVHIYLGILKTDKDEPITYVNVLGFNEIGQNYLKERREQFLLPTKVSKQSKIYLYELRASKWYDVLANTKTLATEIRNKPYIKIASFSKASNQK